MKKVKGYLASDNSFFEHEYECELYDAEQSVRERADEIRVNSDRLVEIIRQLQPEIFRYVQAIQDNNRANQNNKDHRQESAPVQQQSTGKHEPMSDLGSGISAEAVPVERESYGIGSRRNNA